MATNLPKPATVLEHCRVGPPASANAAAQSLSPTFFDLPWLHFHPIRRLLFYDFPCSKTHFLETIVPNFKNSLSQTLQHFLPLAGNLIVPLDSSLPEYRYIPGDSISVTIAESNEASDFNYLTGNQPRVADEFYAFFSQLPEPKTDSELGFQSIPLFSVQITLFPDTGICLGFNNHHVAGDASTIVGFIKAWSTVAKLDGGDDGNLLSNMLPIYDRSLIKDPTGLKDLFWEQMKTIRIESLPLIFPLNKVRATFILKKEDIQKLRNAVQAKNPALVHLSSFTIATAYVWAGLAKASADSGEDVDDDEPEFFAFAVDARSRLDPPLPAAYFGNGLAVAILETTTHGKLKGEDGFVTAVDLVGETISQKINKKGEILKGAEQWMEKLVAILARRLFGVAGSPKFDLYESDFGWGKPIKYEAVGIDGDGSMSLCKSREYEGGLEIGLSLPVKKMEAFAAYFSSGLNV